MLSGFVSVVQAFFAANEHDMTSPLLLLPPLLLQAGKDADKRIFDAVQDTESYVAANDEMIAVVFRGTKEVPDWSTNLNVWRRDTPKSWGVPPPAAVHQVRRCFTASQLCQPIQRVRFWMFNNSCRTGIAGMLMARVGGGYFRFVGGARGGKECACQSQTANLKRRGLFLYFQATHCCKPILWLFPGACDLLLSTHDLSEIFGDFRSFGEFGECIRLRRLTRSLSYFPLEG